jgi:nucleotide-binding universal stress UspA family protein
MTDWTRIVCAVALDNDSRVLLDTASSLASKLGAELTLLHVVPTGEPKTMVAPPERIQALVTEAGLPLLDLAAKAASCLGRAVATRVEHGEPASEILRTAQESGCDLLILGTHGRRGLGRALFGSVAEKVVRAAPCPVLTVRPL